MTKHIFKKLLIFGIVVVLFGCSEELYEENFTDKSKIIFKEKKFNELLKDKKFNNLMQSISGKSFISRTTFENQNGFTISNGNVKIIQTDSLLSYTMFITRDSLNSNSTVFENLVIQENYNGNQKAYIIKYLPTSITPTIHQSIIYSGLIQKKHLAFTGFNRGDSYQNITQSDCYVDQLWCSQPYSGSTEHHLAGKGCKIGTLYIKRVKVLCDTEEPFDGFSSGSGSGTGSDFSGGGSGGTGTGGTSTGTITPTEEDPEVITSPVEPFIDGLAKTPCSELKKISTTLYCKAKLNELKTKTGEESEYGYSITKNQIGNLNPPIPCDASSINPNEIIMPVGGNKIGAFHTHPDASSTSTFPMFSDGDLNWLFWVAKRQNNNGQPKEYSEFFLTLTVPQGTFAIKIKDWAKFEVFRNSIKWKNTDDGYTGQLDVLRKAYKKIGPTGNFNSLKNALLKILTSSDTGIGLYEANDDLSNWSELSLAPNSTNDPTVEPTKEPCQ